MRVRLGVASADEQARSSPVTWHAPEVKRVAGTAFPRFLRALTLAFGVIAGVAAPSLAPAADETPAAFISTIGNDALAEMCSTASLDQKLAYFCQMLSQDFDLDGISRFVLGPNSLRIGFGPFVAHAVLFREWRTAVELIKAARCIWANAGQDAFDPWLARLEDLDEVCRPKVTF